MIIDDHNIYEIDSGIQKIALCFMNTSNNPVYISNIGLKCSINEHEMITGYKVDPISVGQFEESPHYYQTILYETEVSDYDDGIMMMCVKPGDYSILYLDIRFRYPIDLLSDVYKIIEKEWPEIMDENIENSERNRMHLYYIFDAAMFNYLFDRDIRKVNVTIKYHSNGNEDIITERVDFAINPAFSYEGMILL